MARNSTAREEAKGRRPRILAQTFCATEGQRRPLDNILSSAEQRELARIATLFEYQTGGVAIFAEGEDAHFLYLIADGIVRISRHLPDGARQVLGFMWPGDLFGLAEDGHYINSTECLTPAAIFRFPLERLQGLLMSEPLLQLHLLTKAAHELRNAQRQIIVLGRFNSARRLASLLLDSRQHEAFFDSETRILHLPMSRFDIADYLGITAESVTRAFVALEREGFVRRISPRSVELLDAKGLAQFVRGVRPR